MSSELSQVKTFFESLQVYLSPIWLESCIQWCKEENLRPNYTLNDLQTKVYEQWLLLDLRDVEAPCLPQNLSTKTNFILNGNFCLQMMQVVDISKPKLWQLQQIRKMNLLTRSNQQESETVGTGKRVLQFTLTDGVQEIEAMEYRPIPCLNLNLPPGVKIRIMGPVTIRRGRLLLEQQNVKILGGEVEELLVTNSAENVLARALKLPENPHPTSIQENLLVIENEEKNFQTIQTLPTRKITTQTSVINRDSEEERRMAQEVEILLEAERELNSKTPDLFEDVDFDEDFDFKKVGGCSTQIPAKKSTNVLDFEDDDVFDNVQFEQLNQETNKEITIATLISDKSQFKTGIKKIKTKFKSVIEKLTVNDDEYKIMIEIEDSSGSLVAKLHSNIVAEFAGFTPAQILELKSNILNKDEDAVDKVMKALQRVKDKLLLLDNIMDVDISGQVPVIIKIY